VGGTERDGRSTNFFGDRSGTALGVVDFGVDATGSDVGHGGLECDWGEVQDGAKEVERVRCEVGRKDKDEMRDRRRDRGRERRFWMFGRAMETRGGDVYAGTFGGRRGS
jgi:hypothetical protein